MLRREQLGNYALPGIIFISAMLSYALLFRWSFTHITPVQTFGRIWQYYVSWFDFGFHRRGLVGTILTETGINRLAKNEVQFAYIFYAGLLLLLYVLIARIFFKYPRLRENIALCICVFLSPVTFLHFAYCTGNLDNILIILVVLALFYVRNFWILSALLACGVLVHELFIYLLPIIFLLRILIDPSHAALLKKENIIPVLAVIAAIILVTSAGRLNHIPIDVFNAHMEKRIPLAAYQKPLWSGYFEISSGVEEQGGQKLHALWAYRTYIILPTLYVLILAFSTAYYLQAKKLYKIALAIAILFPLLAAVVAWDYYRWVSLSGCLGLMSILLLTSKNKLTLPKHILMCLILFSFLAPFGPDVLPRPFPIQQTILEKLSLLEK